MAAGTKEKYPHNTIQYKQIALYVAPSHIKSFVKRSGSLYVLSEDMLPFLMDVLEMQPDPIEVLEDLPRPLRRQAEKILAAAFPHKVAKASE